MNATGAAYVIPFTAEHDELALLGGKARNLAELTRCGFPVPPGYTITTGAYALASQGAEMDRLLAELARVPAADRERLAALAAGARAILGRAALDPEVARQIVAAYATLGAGTPVAVRSSATAEDLAAQSFAGQQDTYLNVVGEAALLDAVRSCWASLYSERAVVYRARNCIDQRSVRLAVVVQRMVHAAAAGVLFTANPITGRRREAVINASPGLGEAVVSGAVNPDHYIVDMTTGELRAQHLGDKPQDGPCLSAARLGELVAMGSRVEAHYRAPQDIEFAYDEEGRLWLTQTRPITTLFPIPAHSGGAPPETSELRVYLSATADEGVTRPITPMGLMAFRMLAGAAAEVLWGARPRDRTSGPDMVTEAALRTYYDVTAIVRSSLGRSILRSLYQWADAHTATRLRALEADPRLAPTPTSPWRVLRGALVPLGRTRLPWFLARCLLNPEAMRQRNQRAMDAVLARGELGPGATLDTNVGRALELLWEGSLLIPWVLGEASAGVLALGAAALLLGKRATEQELQVVMRGLPNNPTTQMNLALWELAAGLSADAAAARALGETTPEDLARAYHAQALPPALQRGLAGLLARYGHRAVAEIDLGLPRWSEDPAHLLGVLANYLRCTDASAAPDALWRHAQQEALAMLAELTARCRGPRRALVQLALARARALGGVREQWKYDLAALYARVRTLLHPVGSQLAHADQLDAADDVFFLTLPEARQALAGADLRGVARARHEEYRSELTRKRIPALLLSDGTEPGAAEPVAGGSAGAGELRGTPASPGRVRGRARVLLDPTGARIEPGEVLVAPSTDPGWTPLFMTAGGLVMEKGGAISHGAVVAREMGIPAVVGVPDATTRIETGQLIEVDGTTGRIVVKP